MSEVAVFALMSVSFVAWLWLTIRVAKSSPAGSVFTFIFGLPAFYFLFKYWHDEERNIRVPFAVNLVISVALIGAMLSVPSYKSDFTWGRTQAAARAPIKSNPEMETWCRSGGAVYDSDLGTCIEGDPKQAKAEAAQDVMEQLEAHFANEGMAVLSGEMDKSTPAGRGFAQAPEFSRVAQFEVRAQSVMPTLFFVAECVTAKACSNVESNMSHPDSGFAVTRNGNMVFIGLKMFGDSGKIEQARKIFQAFPAV